MTAQPPTPEPQPQDATSAPSTAALSQSKRLRYLRFALWLLRADVVLFFAVVMLSVSHNLLRASGGIESIYLLGSLLYATRVMLQTAGTTLLALCAPSRLGQFLAFVALPIVTAHSLLDSLGLMKGLHDLLDLGPFIYPALLGASLWTLRARLGHGRLRVLLPLAMLAVSAFLLSFQRLVVHDLKSLGFLDLSRHMSGFRQLTGPQANGLELIAGLLVVIPYALALWRTAKLLQREQTDPAKLAVIFD